MSRVFVGFGFGAIQGGLFLPEACRSGAFSRLVVSEIDASAVAALRAADGTYSCNVAHADRLETVRVEGVEVLNPLVPEDRVALLAAIAQAAELATALPSYTLYDAGGEASVARLLAEGFAAKSRASFGSGPIPAVVYAAENDARAATRLRQACLAHLPDGFGDTVQFSETVIAKMCSVVTDPERIAAENLVPVTPDSSRAFLVEAFDQILVEPITSPGFESGFPAFVPKTDLAPFALTKFLGHNANHALLGYLAREQGLRFMHEAGLRPDLMAYARTAFLEESGPGLRHHFASIADPLFTEVGFQAYAEDAMTRMVNPYLRDPVDRVTRDPARKLGWEDRLLGSMCLARQAGVTPRRLAQGARLALRFLLQETNRPESQAADTLREIWKDLPEEQTAPLAELILA